MDITKRRFSSRFFTLVLSFSALTGPVQGMEDWSPIFNPDDLDQKAKALGTVGTRIFSCLDERSLGKVAQVSRNWNQLAHYVRVREYPAVYRLPRSLIQPQGQLTQDILESTHAIPDPFSPLIEEIRGEAFTLAMEGLSLQQKNQIKTQFPNVIDSSLSLYPWHLLREENSLKVANTLTAEHPGFKRLTDIKGVLKNLCVTFPPLSSSLERLEQIYEDYIMTICSLPPQDREVFLSPVFLSGDFIKGSYLISRSMAYQVLSMGELGIPEKKNATGSSLVTHVGTIYAKQNLIKARQKEDPPTGTLDPGMEWGMYSFHRLLFGKGLVPSSLIALSSVPVKLSLSREKQEEERNLLGRAEALGESGGVDKVNILNRLHEDLSFKSTKAYALQVTPEVQGEFLGTFLEKALKNPTLFEELDKEQVQSLILFALLTHPADAKGDNFIVTFPDARGKRQIISIDNDLSLASMIIKEREGFHSLETRNILFCVPFFMEQEIEEHLRTHLLSLNPESFLLTWLKSLTHHNKQYEALEKILDPQAETVRPPQERGIREETTASNITLTSSSQVSPSLLPSPLASSLLRLPLKFKQGTEGVLLERLQRLQKILGRTDFLIPTLQIIFEEMNPLAALYTQRLLQKESNSLKAFDRIYRQDLSLEKVLNSTDRLRNEQKVEEALQKETTVKDAYRTRTQVLEESVKNFLQQTDLFKHPDLRGFLTTAIEAFGDLIKTFPASSFHDSWSRDGLILKAIAAKVPESILQFLLERGLDGSKADAEGKTAFHYIIEHHAPTSFLKLLHQHYKGKDVFAWLNRKVQDGLTALDLAMKNHQFEHVKTLIDLGDSDCKPEIALKFYNTSIKVRKDESLKNSFLKLIHQNDEVRWHICLEEMLPPRQSSQNDISIVTSKFKTRYLPLEISKQVLTPDNQWIPYTENGNHIVCRAIHKAFGIEHSLYFKIYPELPGIEEAVGSLTRKLLGYGAPHTELANMNGIPVLISHSHGDKTKTLDDVLRYNPHCLQNSEEENPYGFTLVGSPLPSHHKLLGELDEESLSGLILVAMLINPEDGKPSNYVIEPHPIKSGKYRIVGIDNDHAFVPAIVKEKPDKELFSRKIIPIAQVKTILYCLDQMKQAIPSIIRDLFINLRPDVLLEEWLQKLKITHARESGLFPKTQEQCGLFSEHDCVIGVPFQKGAIAHLYDKFVMLRDALSRFPAITPIELLRKLEPRLAKRYDIALEKLPTVKQRWDAGDALFYETHKNGSQTTITRTGDVLKSMNIPEKESLLESIRKGKANGPDQALEEFKQIKKELESKALEELGARTGDLNILKTLQLESTRARFLEKKDFKEIPLQEQEAILAYLKGKALRELFLKNCMALNDTILTQGLSLKHLIKCDLRGCENISSQGLFYLSQTALTLEELNLSHIKSLKEIGNIGIATDTPLIFKELRFLRLLTKER